MATAPDQAVTNQAADLKDVLGAIQAPVAAILPK